MVWFFFSPDSREPQTKGESYEWLHRFCGSYLKFPTSEGEHFTHMSRTNNLLTYFFIEFVFYNLSSLEVHWPFAKGDNWVNLVFLLKFLLGTCNVCPIFVHFGYRMDFFLEKHFFFGRVLNLKQTTYNIVTLMYIYL